MDNKEIEEIIKYIKYKGSYLRYNYKLYDIYNSNLKPYLVERLASDLRGEYSFREAVSRLSIVNILPKIVNKLSKAYTSASVIVNAEREKPFEELKEIFNLNDYRVLANKMLNLNKCCALEPVFAEEEGERSFIRVLPAHEFLVYSDDPKDKRRVTHFIKVLESDLQSFQSGVYEIYTKDEYVKIKGDGTVLEELENPYGEIPFVYLSRDSVELLPEGGEDDYEMITLLPLLLTDNNYCLKFQAFSIIYIKDAVVGDMSLAPNAVWDIESSGQEGDKAEIGTIKPSLSIDESMKNLLMQYELWLDTKNIKSSTLSHTTENSTRAISGIAKAIDEADITDDIEEQRMVLASAEKKLFEVIRIKSEIIPGYNTLDLGKVSISWEEDNVIPELPLERLERVILKKDNYLTTHLEAIKEANNISENSIALELLSKIEEERNKNKALESEQVVAKNTYGV